MQTLSLTTLTKIVLTVLLSPVLKLIARNATALFAIRRCPSATLGAPTASRNAMLQNGRICVPMPSSSSKILTRTFTPLPPPSAPLGPPLRKHQINHPPINKLQNTTIPLTKKTKPPRCSIMSTKPLPQLSLAI